MRTLVTLCALFLPVACTGADGSDPLLGTWSLDPDAMRELVRKERPDQAADLASLNRVLQILMSGEADAVWRKNQIEILPGGQTKARTEAIEWKGTWTLQGDLLTLELSGKYQETPLEETMRFTRSADTLTSVMDEEQRKSGVEPPFVFRRRR